MTVTTERAVCVYTLSVMADVRVFALIRVLGSIVCPVRLSSAVAEKAEVIRGLVGAEVTGVSPSMTRHSTAATFSFSGVQRLRS